MGCDGEAQHAHAVVTALRATGVRPNLGTYTARLSSCEKKQQWWAASDITENIQEHSIRSDVVSCSILLRACEKRSQWLRGLAIVLDLQSRCVRTDAITYNTVVDGFEKGTRWQRAVGTLAEMPARGLEPDVIGNTAAIDSCKAVEWERALALWSGMLQSSLQPSRVTCDVVARVCVDRETWACALVTLAEIVTRGIQPGFCAHVASMSAREQSGSWEHALNMMTVVREVALESDVVGCGVYLGACERLKQWEMALSILARMCHQGPWPDAICFNSVVGTCGKGRWWERACASMGLMGRRILEPDLVSFGAATTACERSEQWDRALGCMELVMEGGICPDVIGISAAISACSQKGAWACASQVLAAMHVQLLQPSIISQNMGISACEKAERWEHAMGRFMHMLASGLRPSAVTRGSTLSACGKSGRWSQSLLLLAEGHRNVANPNTASYSATILTCGEAKQWSVALDVVGRARANLSPNCLLGLAWAFAALDVRDADIWQRLASVSATQIKDLDLESLSALAWSFASAGTATATTALLRAAAEELIARLAAGPAQLSESASVATAKCVAAAVWAFNLSGLRSEPLVARAHVVMRDIGRGLDVKSDGLSGVLQPVAAAVEPRRISGRGDFADEPRVSKELADLMVVHKPKGWEVADRGALAAAQALSAYVRARFAARRLPLPGDVRQCSGILHRLDVPSSGLILASKTYESYYDLQVQLNAGAIARDYVILCRGSMPSGCSSVVLRGVWKGDSSSCTGWQRKISRTSVKLVIQTT